MGNFNFEIPEELHKKFKAMCALKGKDMRVYLLEIMDQKVKDETN